MKKWGFLALSLMTSLSLTSWKSQAEMSIPNELSSQITEYYRHRNFAVAFSSEVEQEIIIDSLICRGALDNLSPDWSSQHLEFCGEIPDLPESERLDAIEASIKELDKRVLPEETNSLIPGYLPGSGSLMRKSDPNLVPLPSSADLVPPTLLKINQVQSSENSVTLEVTAFPINPEENVKLIEQYEEYESREKVPVKKLMQSVATSITHKEFHHWVLIDGNWKKLQSDTLLIGKEN